MVQVTHQIPLLDSLEVDAAAWFVYLYGRYPKDSVVEIEKTYTQGLALNAPDAMNQGLWMAAILSELLAGPTTLSAALIYPFYTSQVLSEKKLGELFAPDLVRMVLGAWQLHSLEVLIDQGRSAGNSEALRKMLLTMVNDVRVVLIQLALQVFLLRHLDRLEAAQQKRLAQRVSVIYAPLANRLGIGQLKWEMEDLAFHVTHPAAYAHIKQQLDERRQDRERYMADFMRMLETLIQTQKIKAEISGRVKHIFSIFRKMEKKHLDFDALFDIRAVRLLTQDINSCYRLLSLIHEHFMPIQSEFSDYIASPKPNGYQSIHTVIQGPQGRLIEVQIRTFEMHEDSEMGVAAHWRYKEGHGRDIGLESRIHWLRSLLEWQKELGASSSQDTPHPQDDRIYVLTPQGDVFDLPMGSTPLDFAYRVHTTIGHRFRGAKVDGVMVPMTTHLQTGQRVEILTRAEIKPSRDWLDKRTGVLNSPRARQKVQQWFREQDPVASLEKAEKSDKSDKSEKPEKSDKIDKLESLSAPLPDLSSLAVKHPSKLNTEALTIHGVDNMMFRMAGCCKPVYGDGVQGYITQGRGVTIHRMQCPALQMMQARSLERIVPVHWGREMGRYEVSLVLVSQQRDVTLKALTQLLAQQKIGILGLHTQRARERELDLIRLALEIESRDRLAELQNMLARLPEVIEVRRGE